MAQGELFGGEYTLDLGRVNLKSGREWHSGGQSLFKIPSALSLLGFRVCPGDTPAVPTVTFRLLFCFVILSHDRRRILHLNLTAHPTAAWAAQQIREAFPGHGAEPRYLLRDRDGAYGDAFRRVVRMIGIREILTAPQSPWQNPYAERLIGSIRRECLDHLIVLNEGHLRKILKEYVRYYNQSRPHLSLDRNAPIPRDIEPPSQGSIVAFPEVGGLHHRYTRAA
jgi:putative transposase